MTTNKKIRRAPGIYQRGPDKKKLTIKIPLGRDPVTNKKRDSWIGFEGSVADAKIERGRLLAERKAGRYVEPSNLTVDDHLKNWLRDHARRNVNGKTAERYGEIVDHIIMTLGHFRLDKLRAPDVQRYYSEAQENGRRCRKKDVEGPQGLSKRTVLHHHRVLKMALRYAVDMDLLSKNPADRAKPPRPEENEMKFLDQADTARLLKAVEGLAIYIPVLLAATTGMRRGEILGLRWRDVDLAADQDAGFLTVSQNLQQTKSNPSATDEMTRRGLAFKPPKTTRSRRKVSLYPSTIEALRRHKARQAEYRILKGLGRDDLGLVCALPDGTPRSPRELTKEFKRVTKGLGFDIRFHDLRHGHVTHCFAAGMNPREIADRVGHASAKMTLDVYAHTLPGSDKDAAGRLDKALQAHMSQ